MNKWLKTWLAFSVVFVVGACPAHAIIDADGDGMSDIWEDLYGLSTTDNGEFLTNGDPGNSDEGPNADPDGDGWTNFQESIAGTDPFSGELPDGLLQTHIAQNPAVPGVFLVSWPTLAGKQYTLRVSPDMTSGSWTQVGDPIIGDGTPIEIAIDTTNSSPPPEKLFWRTAAADIDTDTDGLSDYDEGIIGTLPDNPDTDGDGFGDAGEKEKNTNPNDVNEHGNMDWFVLKGNKAQGQPKTDTRDFILGKGQKYIVVVGTTSEEYPDWTVYESEYNDALAWEITPSEGVAITGNISVNERHDDWDADLLAGVELNGFSPVHIEKVKVIEAVTEDVTIRIKLTATNVSDGELPSTVIVGLIPLKIEPDAGMAGVIGDSIESSQGYSGEGHFVTPKKTTEVPADFVDLKVTGLETPAWITAGNSNQLVEWAPATGEELGDAPTKWRVSRAGAAKHPSKIRTIAKYGNEEAAKLNVWVVWLNGAKVADRALTTTVGLVTTDDGTKGPGLAIGAGYDFTFSITPASICTDSDRPILAGPPINNGALVDTPGSGTFHILDNSDLSGGATLKWDVSRRVRSKVLNPNLYPESKLYEAKGSMWANQPVASDIPASYPSDIRIGNDDTGTGDEDNNPYQASSFNHNTHGIGELASTDYPTLPMLNSLGSDGDTFEQRLHFGEFSRLLIGGTWFRTSDFFDWRFHAKFRRQSGAWTDDGSLIETNNTGF